MRRSFWALAGGVVGFVAAVWALAGIRRTRTRLSPANVPARLGEARSTWRDAVAAGREAMTAYEHAALERLEQGAATGPAGRADR